MLFNDIQSFALGTRKALNFVTGFIPGVQLKPPTGPVAIEDLKKDDLLVTRDHGCRRIRWIGTARRVALGTNTPIRIEAGALGLPLRDRSCHHNNACWSA